MKLRFKVPLFFLLIIIGFVILIHYILTTVILKSYIQLEQQESVKVSERLQQSLGATLDALNAKSGDWANWDDAYQFVQNKNQAFITSNIQDETFNALKINVMIFYNISGAIVYSRGYDLEKQKEIPLSSFWESTTFKKEYPQFIDSSKNMLGFVSVDGRLMMIVLRQILTSNAAGPSHGMLLFGRYLDDQQVKSLAEIQKNPLNYYLYSDPHLPADFQKAKASLTVKNNTFILRESESILGVYTLFTDVSGNPVAIFEEMLNRDIYLYGKRNTYNTELLIIGVGLVSALIAITVLLNSLILSRLARLTKEVQKIGPSGSLSARVGSYGTDELGLLAGEFNRTLQSLENITDEKIYQERQSQSLLSVMEEAVILTGDHDAITYTNPACEKFFGFTEAEYKGKKMSDLLKFSSMFNKSLNSTYLEELPKSSGTAKRVTVYIEGKYKKVAAIVTFSPIVVERMPKGVIYVFHDITKEAELNQQKDDFFSIASHELRTPLMVISGNMDNILQGYGNSTVSETDKKSLMDAMNSSDRLIRLVNDYLNVSRLDQGRYVLNIKPLNMCALLESVSTEMNPLFQNHGLTFQRNCEGNHGNVMGDEDKVKEVLINLIGNSLKFTKQGGITVTHSVKDGMLVTNVTDTGMGIALDKQHLLFSRFQQAMDNTLTRQAGGTGLGLYISREFVRLMGGELWLAQSEPNHGSTFTFTLPIVKE